MSIFEWDPAKENKCRQIDAMVQHSVSQAMLQDDPESQSQCLESAVRALWPFVRFTVGEMGLKYPLPTRATRFVELPIEFPDMYVAAKRKFSRRWSIEDLSWPDLGSLVLYSFVRNNVSLDPSGCEEMWRSPLLCQYRKSIGDCSFLSYVEGSLKQDEVSILEPEVTSLVRDVKRSEDGEEEYRKGRQHAIALMLAPFVYRAYARYVSKTPWNHEKVPKERGARVEYQLSVTERVLEKYVLLRRDEYIQTKATNERTLCIHAYDFGVPLTVPEQRRWFAAKIIKSLYKISGGVNEEFRDVELHGATAVCKDLAEGVDEESRGEEPDDVGGLDPRLYTPRYEEWARFLSNVTMRYASSRQDAERVLLFHLWALHIDPLYLRACFGNEDVAHGEFSLKVERNSPDLFQKRKDIKLPRNSFYDLVKDEYAHKRTISEVAEIVGNRYRELGLDVDCETLLSDPSFSGDLLLQWKEWRQIEGKHFSEFVTKQLRSIMDDSDRYFRDQLSKCMDAMRVWACKYEG